MSLPLKFKGWCIIVDDIRGELTITSISPKNLIRRTMRWTVTVERDDFSKDYYIILPDKLLERVEWKEGDTLKLDVIKMGIDTSLQITKRDDNA